MCDSSSLAGVAEIYVSVLSIYSSVYLRALESHSMTFPHVEILVGKNAFPEGVQIF